MVGLMICSFMMTVYLKVSTKTFFVILDFSSYGIHVLSDAKDVEEFGMSPYVMSV